MNPHQYRQSLTCWFKADSRYDHVKIGAFEFILGLQWKVVISWNTKQMARVDKRLRAARAADVGISWKIHQETCIQLKDIPELCTVKTCRQVNLLG